MTDGIRVVVIGATGNIGTSVVEALSGDPRVNSIVGIARRKPDWQPPKLHIHQLDIATADEETLDAVISGAHVVIQLAWLFQPTHNPIRTWRTNVLGTLKVFDAVAR